ncbi:hemerythrin [Methanoculleus sediminis]|uniref:Hemerythrin n=1 Tax=Methanoculleus sediminis TaxID=1550566 RepID=A0A0H1QZA4_9EURY|nr:hemerythrin domain-containing protein [Methanoculleus sediminis]KLK88144.1 hemerythrin [Methanoculleus sediminis]
MPQILELIREDHDLIRALFDELESNPETRDVRCITLRRELPGHMYAEEVTLYAHLRDRVPEEIRRSLDEHTEVRETLVRFERIPQRDDAWMPALADLRERVEAHFASEESEVFARAEEHLGRNDLFALSETFEREKVAAARYIAV